MEGFIVIACCDVLWDNLLTRLFWANLCNVQSSRSFSLCTLHFPIVTESNSLILFCVRVMLLCAVMRRRITRAYVSFKTRLANRVQPFTAVNNRSNHRNYQQSDCADWRHKNWNAGSQDPVPYRPPEQSHAGSNAACFIWFMWRNMKKMRRRCENPWENCRTRRYDTAVQLPCCCGTLQADVKVGTFRFLTSIVWSKRFDSISCFDDLNTMSIQWHMSRIANHTCSRRAVPRSVLDASTVAYLNPLPQVRSLVQLPSYPMFDVYLISVSPLSVCLSVSSTLFHIDKRCLSDQEETFKIQDQVLLVWSPHHQDKA